MGFGAKVMSGLVFLIGVACFLASGLAASSPVITLSASDSDTNVRVAAVEKVTDQAALGTIAGDDPDPNVRYAAAGRIQDADLLRRIVDNDETRNEHSRMRTLLALRKLLVEAELPDKGLWILLRVKDEGQGYCCLSGSETVRITGETVEISIIRDETVLAS
jgi:hypothetical protein